MNGYGQAYTNPLATGTSPDAQQAAIAAALQKLSANQNGITSGVNVSPVSGASLSGLSSIQNPSSLPGASGSVGKFASGLQTAGTAVDILGGLSQIYLGFQANKLAKKNFNFQVGAYNNNLQNTVQSYNTSLEDRIRARHNTEDRSSSETSDYISKNRLSANTLG